VLAVCGGAMRRYLAHHDELPRQALRAFAPISTRTADQAGTAGNQISGMIVSMHTDEPDALKRLGAIRESTRESKEMNEAIGARTLTDVTQFLPGALAGISARLIVRTGMMSRLSPVVNTIVTNVPGPQIPLYFTKARMVMNLGMGFPADGMALLHIITSYNGRIAISITCCRDLMPDPGFYAECLEESFRELYEAAVI